MPVPRHRDIRVGTLVSIVLKADQRTGRQVQGTVAQLLTRGDHPRGVKVRLADGRVGRVQQLASGLSQAPTTSSQSRPTRMNPDDHNPWQSAPSQGNPYVSGQSQSQPQPQLQSQYTQPGQQTPQRQHHSGGASHEYYQNSQQQSRSLAPPAPNVQRSDTETLLAQQSDRAEQLEHMQNYESAARETQDDKDQAQLQKEFPDIDSSLIAALYGDTKDLSATREMLQELARS